MGAQATGTMSDWRHNGGLESVRSFWPTVAAVPTEPRELSDDRWDNALPMDAEERKLELELL